MARARLSFSSPVLLIAFRIALARAPAYRAQVQAWVSERTASCNRIWRDGRALAILWTGARV